MKIWIIRFLILTLLLYILKYGAFLYKNWDTDKIKYRKDIPSPKDVEGNRRVTLIQIIRNYMSPLQALIDQNPKWQGGFKTEIADLKEKGRVSEPVQFKLYYPDDLRGMEITSIAIPSKIVPGIECDKLIKGDVHETRKAEIIMRNLLRAQSSKPTGVLEVSATKDIRKRATNCMKYRESMRYIMESVSLEEEHFPLAYSILVYTSVLQVERLLHAIYRPQNYYCIHVDRKSNESIHEGIGYLGRCFENVFVVPKPCSVRWGSIGVLRAELICMRHLWDQGIKNKKMWKYFLNLTGQEFPLKTNWELVQILKSYKGALDIGHTTSSRWNERRRCPKWMKGNCTEMTPELKSLKLTFSKGPVHVALTPDFVKFSLFSNVTRELLTWLEDKYIPDETYFSTLFLNPRLAVPGLYTGGRSKNVYEIQPLVRYKKWDWLRPCRGKSMRWICIMTIWDLPELAVRPEMFANKFVEDYHPMAYDCLEELLWNRTREDIIAAQTGKMYVGLNGKHDLPYSRLPWVKKHV